MKRGFVIAAACAGLVSWASADTVTLTSGEKIEGKITSETPESVTMQYSISESIMDERVIERVEIAKIEKPQPDEILYQQLKNVKPDPATSFPLERYDGMIAALNSFLSKFPASAHAAEAKANVTALTEEKARVEQGNVKYLGEWLSASAAAERQVQIDAQHVLAEMRAQIASGDLIEALNVFALMEKNYARTRSYPTAVELARQLVVALKKQVVQRQRDLASKEADFKKNFALTPESGRAEILAARKREEDRANATLAAAEKSQIKWKPLIPGSAKSLDTLDKAATSEATRLAAVPVESMRASSDAADKARQAIEAKDLAAADSALKVAAAKWPGSEDVQYLTKKLAQAKSPAKPAPSAAGIPSVASPAASPGATPTPTGTPQPAAASPQPASPASPSPSAKISPQVAPTSVPTSSPAKKVTKAAPAPAPTPETPFYMTIPGALAIVGGILVLLGGAAIFNRMKAKRGEAE